MVSTNKTTYSINDIPRHKRILETAITVDCFDIPLSDCSHYFLSHFHADHYTKLTKSFKFPVYCSKTTSNLVSGCIGAVTVGLEMYTNYDLGSFVVRLIDANHCPGSVCFIFLVDDQFILHTGDFRYSKIYHTFDIHFKTIYLDNTYENAVDFPTQKDAISRILGMFDQKNSLCPQNVCVLCCSYRVGKEKIFLSVAEYLDEKIQVTKEKLDIYSSYSQYTVDKINRDVLEIVNQRRCINSTFGFTKKTVRNVSTRPTNRKSYFRQNGGIILPEPSIVAYKNANILALDNVSDISNNLFDNNNLFDTSKSSDTNKPFDNDNIFDTSKLSDSSKSSDINNSSNTSNNLFDSRKSSGTNYYSNTNKPFDRFTEDEAPIKVVSINNLNKLSEIVSGIYADRIVVLIGTGWNEKVEYKPYTRPDGRKIKNGIEIVYFRYSEHSSPSELAEFKKSVSYDYIINTVRNI